MMLGQPKSCQKLPPPPSRHLPLRTLHCKYFLESMNFLGCWALCTVKYTIRSIVWEAYCQKGNLVHLHMIGQPRDKRDGHLLFEVEMYLQKGCIMVSGVESS